MAKSAHFWIRKSHRYLGVLIGIQFLMWTLGGLYFSWSDLDEIHGDHLRGEASFLQANTPLISPQISIGHLPAPVDSIHSLQLVFVLNKPHYRIRYFTHTGTEVRIRTFLADAQTGSLRDPLTREEAIKVAQGQAHHSGSVKKVELLEQVGSHHEYREKPLPAYAIHFNEPAYTAYVGVETGSLETVRHSKWRIFDFLWMLHTMDYEGRDNFSNWLLKAFSIFGLFTVISGFGLYFVSSRRFR